MFVEIVSLRTVIAVMPAFELVGRFSFVHYERGGCLLSGGIVASLGI